MFELYSMKNNAADSISFFLIVLWVYAAVSKLSDYDLFVSQLQMQPLPGWSIRILAWVLPVAELLLAFSLASKKCRGAGLAFSFSLMLLFTNYTAIVLSGAFGKIPCSCGGIFSFVGWTGHLIFNVTATVAALTGYFLHYFATRLPHIPIRKYLRVSGKEAENPQKKSKQKHSPAAEP